jgi:hypothetical protein
MSHHFSRPNFTFPTRRALLTGSLAALSIGLLTIAEPDYAQNAAASPTAMTCASGSTPRAGLTAKR